MVIETLRNPGRLWPGNCVVVPYGRAIERCGTGPSNVGQIASIDGDRGVGLVARVYRTEVAVVRQSWRRRGRDWTVGYLNRLIPDENFPIVVSGERAYHAGAVGHRGGDLWCDGGKVRR